MCPRSPGGVLSFCAYGSQADRPHYGLQNLPRPLLGWSWWWWCNLKSSDLGRFSCLREFAEGPLSCREIQRLTEFLPSPLQGNIPPQKREMMSECSATLVLQDTCFSTAAPQTWSWTPWGGRGKIFGKTQINISKGMKRIAFLRESNCMPLGVSQPGISLLRPWTPSMPQVLDSHLLPPSGGSLWNPSPAIPRGARVDKEQPQQPSPPPPRSGWGPPQTGSATFWKSRDRFPGGSLVSCQSRETEKLKNSPTRPSWWFSG